jgi:GTPase SAR1 family protein
VVVGDVGVGKTSFFENLFEHLDASERANTYFIHVMGEIPAGRDPEVDIRRFKSLTATLRSSQQASQICAR